MLEPLYWTAGSFFVIGTVVFVIGARIWWMTPEERAARFAPYITSMGVVVGMRHWTFVALFGSFILLCAAEHLIHTLAEHGTALEDAGHVLAVLEAMVAVPTAFYVLALVGLWLWKR
jgi:hypothetical protein